MEKEKILFTALSVSELSNLMENSVRNAISDSDLKIHDADELLNTRQAGALINYKASTLYGLAKQNKIPFSKTAGKLLFSRKKLLEWVSTKDEPTEEIQNRIVYSSTDNTTPPT